MKKMKKTNALIIGLLVMTLLLSAANALAGGTGTGTGAAFKPPTTPGAKATQQAIERATEGPDDDADDAPGAAGHGKRTHFTGILAAIGADSLALTLADNTSRTFAVTGDTKVKIPRLGANATLGALAVGTRVMVHAAQAENGAWTALSIQPKPSKPEKPHHVGVVTAYTAGSGITIQDKYGQKHTYVLTAETKILPRERAGELRIGSRVTIISPRAFTGGAPTAQGVVIHSEEGEGGYDD